MARHVLKAAVALFFIFNIFSFVQAGHSFSLILEDTVPERLDVPYVPTPDEIVSEMIRMAGISENDVVYDLGCGDGRIVITACQKTGARGVGVDIDPERISESRSNAKAANIESKVTFIQQDLFKADFSEATVLALYLLPEINVKLRPRILNDMRPGSRIISHNYSMGEWLPDTARHLDARHSIYFWVVPANIGGTWNCRLQEKDGAVRRILRLEQGYQVVSGDMSSESGRTLISNVRLNGDDLRFTVDRKTPKGTTAVIFTGKAKGNIIEGSFESPEDNGIKGTWRARREPSSVKPLEGSGNKIRKTLRVLK
jgi:SAM-dependent methyltransferase